MKQVTRRYSELLLSLYLISGKTLDPRLHPYLAAMRSASAALIVKLSQEVANKKLRLVFLINTYDAIIQTLRDREKDIPPNDDVNFFDGLLQKQLPQFVTEELAQYDEMSHLARSRISTDDVCIHRYYQRLCLVAADLEAGKDKISRGSFDRVHLFNRHADLRITKICSMR